MSKEAWVDPDSNVNPLEFTLHPKDIFSLQTVVNAAVWGAGGAILGSFVDIPTPVGEYSLASIGGLAGAGGYIGIAAYNKGITGVIEEAEDGFVTWVENLTPWGRNVNEAFKRHQKIGTADGFNLWKKYLQTHPDDYGGKGFNKWLDSQGYK